MSIEFAMNVDATKYLVVGAGATGWSVVNYMRAKTESFSYYGYA